MESKTYKIRKRSRNRLTKSQLKELRKGGYIIFERSYANCLERLNIVKACSHTNPELHKYTFYRMRKLWDFCQKKYVEELTNLGYINKGDNIYKVCAHRDLRNVKISLIK